MQRVKLDTSPEKLTAPLTKKKKKLRWSGLTFFMKISSPWIKVWGKMSANNENDEKSEPIAGFQDINAFTQVGWKYTKQD